MSRFRPLYEVAQHHGLGRANLARYVEENHPEVHTTGNGKGRRYIVDANDEPRIVEGFRAWRKARRSAAVSRSHATRAAKRSPVGYAREASEGPGVLRWAVGEPSPEAFAPQPGMTFVPSFTNDDRARMSRIESLLTRFADSCGVSA